MNAAICPYCRTAIAPDSPEQLLCTGCGTPHHADCFAENGGCTVFGCKNAPSDEQKVTLTGSDLASPAPGASTQPRNPNIPEMLPGVGLMPPGWNPNPQPAPPPQPQKTAPPPLPPGVSARPATPAAAGATPSFAASARPGVGSMFFNAQTIPAAPQAYAPAQAYAGSPFDANFTPDPNAKNRSTFILLGALLGPFGAHNFYAGYYGKAVGQLCLTVFTLGFGGIMTWVWAVIEVCTIDRDKSGIPFRS